MIWENLLPVGATQTNIKYKETYISINTRKQISVFFKNNQQCVCMYNIHWIYAPGMVFQYENWSSDWIWISHVYLKLWISWISVLRLHFILLFPRTSMLKITFLFPSTFMLQQEAVFLPSFSSASKLGKTSWFKENIILSITLAKWKNSDSTSGNVDAQCALLFGWIFIGPRSPGAIYTFIDVTLVCEDISELFDSEESQETSRW